MEQGGLAHHLYSVGFALLGGGGGVVLFLFLAETGILRFQAPCKALSRKKAEALKGKKEAYFPKHTFYYCTKSTSAPPLFSPTQPPGNCTWCTGLQWPTAAPAHSCPQAELCAPGPFQRLGCQAGARESQLTHIPWQSWA